MQQATRRSASEGVSATFKSRRWQMRAGWTQKSVVTEYDRTHHYAGANGRKILLPPSRSAACWPLSTLPTTMRDRRPRSLHVTPSLFLCGGRRRFSLVVLSDFSGPRNWKEEDDDAKMESSMTQKEEEERKSVDARRRRPTLLLRLRFELWASGLARGGREMTKPNKGDSPREERRLHPRDRRGRKRFFRLRFFARTKGRKKGLTAESAVGGKNSSFPPPVLPCGHLLDDPNGPLGAEEPTN